MSTLSEYLHNYLDDRKKSYKLFEGINIQKDYEEENRLKKSYGGREIFELLQNADDASIKASFKSVLFKMDGSRLRISNNGIPFTAESFRAIFFAGMSDKRDREEQIGEKGLGFRSILNWSDDITIESNHLRVHFSREVAKQFLDDMLAEEPVFAESYVSLCSENRYDPSNIAILEVPSVTEYNQPTEYDTSIIISLDQEKIDCIEGQLASITPETLLFLNNIKQIRIETSGRHISFTKSGSNDKVKIEVRDNESASVNEWNIKSSEGTYINKPYKLSIAWNESTTYSDNYLYSFFPTQEAVPLPFLIHGTFDLTPNRNQLIHLSDKNKFLMARLAELCVDVALSLTKTECSYKPLSMLDMKTGNMGDGIKRLNLPNLLDAKIPKSALFPTVNNTYINLSESAFYYSDEYVSRALCGEDVQKLLKYCPYPHIRETILKQYTTEYSDIAFAEIISKRAQNCQNEGYSNYAHLLWRYISSYDVLNLNTPLLIDGDNNLIPWNSNIFLPNGDFKSLTYPDEIPIKFININLLNALKSVSNSKDDSDLQYKFKKFGLRQFSPRMLVEIIAKHYNQKKWTEADVSAFHNIMFGFYKHYRAEVCSYKFSEAIYVFAKDGSLKPAGESYFGSEYENEVTESLYSFDTSKIISPNLALYRCDELSSINEARDYFQWIGISDYPRIVHTEHSGNQPMAYFSYLFERWGYKKSFSGINIKNYTDYASLYPWKKYYVQDVDCLDEILKYSETEAIIAWIHKDRTINKILADDIEGQDSFISASIYGARDRCCYGRELYSHIRWKIMTAAWMTSRSGKRVPPEICTTSQTISDEFSPLIEKPKINESHILLKNKINSRILDQVLDLVGVSKTISEFRTGVIYSVLNRLPEIDSSGIKAKSIYRELASNYDEKGIDEHNSEYVKFTSSGKVFCKDGLYHEIQKTFYLPDKRFGDSVTKNFNVITIDTRKNAERIRLIFHTEKIRVTNIKIVGTPTVHPLNDKFSRDIEDFKPFVYLFRMDNDQDGSSREKLKEVKFVAVTDLSYSFEKEGAEITIQLIDYEFFFDRTRRIVYLRLPSEIDYDRLKEHKLLGAAVREAFATIFDINSDNWMVLREMFTSSIAGREDIVRDQFEDENLSKLESAEKCLGLIHNYKLSFWKSIVKCIPEKELPESDYSDEELAKTITELFPECSSEIENAFDAINNYSDYSSDVNSSKCVSRLLRKIGISLEQFNRFAFPQFNLKTLYFSEYNQHREQIRDIILSRLYAALQKTTTEQKNFNKYKRQYDDLRGINVPNSLEYNIEEDITKDLTQVLPIIGSDNTTTIIDYTSFYIINKSALIEQLKETCSENVIDDFISNKEYDSLLYFEEGTKELLQIIRERVKQTSQNSYSNNTPIRIGNHQISYNSRNELFSKFGEIEIDFGNVKAITIKKRQASIHAQKDSSYNSPVGKISMGKIKKENEIYGGLGEHYAYRYLCKIHEGTDIKVIWVSDNARIAGINPEGGDGQGYDICLKKDGQIVRYIEVKTGDSNAFHITRNEIDIASSTEVCRLYDIYVVRHIKEGNPDIEIIETPFKFPKGQSLLSNDKFEIINDNYTLCYTK